MKLLYLLIIIILFNQSCKTNIETIEQEIEIINGNEDFISFIDYFLSDTVFQSKRSNTPYIVSGLSIDDRGVTRDTVISSENKRDWMLSMWRGKSPINISITSERAIVTFESTSEIKDNYLYCFTLSEGKWYLNSMSNHGASPILF